MKETLAPNGISANHTQPMTDFLIFIKDSENAPPRFVAAVEGKEPEEGALAIEESVVGEGEYLAFPADAAVVRQVKANFSLEGDE